MSNPVMKILELTWLFFIELGNWANCSWEISCTASKSIHIADRHHVVYQYICPRDGCNSTQSYIGYTTSSVANRFRMRTQNCSSIKNHAKNTHNLNKVTSVELLECVKILKQSPNKRELLFLEALCRKSFKPSMNAQSEFSDRILKIFKH